MVCCPRRSLGLLFNVLFAPYGWCTDASAIIIALFTCLHFEIKRISPDHSGEAERQTGKKRQVMVKIRLTWRRDKVNQWLESFKQSEEQANQAFKSLKKSTK